MFAKGLTSGEIAADFAEVCVTRVSEDTISRITDRVVDEMNTWMNRPLEPIYAAIFLDAIVIKVNRPRTSVNDVPGLHSWPRHTM